MIVFIHLVKNIGNGADCKEWKEEKIGHLFEAGDHVGGVDPCGKCCEDEEKNEDEDGGFDPTADKSVGLTICFHREKDRSMHGKKGASGDADEDGVGLEEIGKRSDIILRFIEGNSLNHIPDEKA